MDPPGSSLRELLTRFVNVSKRVKEDTVRRDGVGADIAPFVGEFDEGGLCRMYVIAAGDDVSPVSAVPAIVANTTARIVGYVGEGYRRTPGNPVAAAAEAARGTAPGTYARQFAAGDPKVDEVLLHCLYDVETREAAAAVSPYSYEVGRKVRWAEDQRIYDGWSGRIADAIAKGIALRGSAPADDFEFLGLNDVLKIRRNEPCPCGSGRKAKLCCLR